MSCTYLMTTNYISTDVVSNATFSSEQTAFPASNIYNAQRRSKVWRSNGYWEITSSNNVIKFEETSGTTLTASLTVNNYTSTTAFLAEIKTQMESVGGSTYTVSTDSSTNKIKLTSDGSGGTGIFNILWTSSTLGAVLGFDTSSNDTGLLTYIADSLKINTSEWFKWDMGISTNPKAFILIGKRNEPIHISPSATLKLQGNETDIWNSPSYEQTLTYDDRTIIKFSSDGLHTESLRFWRFLIDDTSNPDGYVEIGNIFLGDYFSSTRGAVAFPFQGNYIDKSVTVFSVGGQSYSDVQPQSEGFSIRWSLLTTEEKEEITSFWNDVGTHSPFFISFDSNAAFSSSENYYVRYCKFLIEPQYLLSTPDNFSINMNLREEL